MKWTFEDLTLEFIPENGLFVFSNSHEYYGYSCTPSKLLQIIDDKVRMIRLKGKEE